MEENTILINGGIIINVDVCVENVMSVKKIIFGIFPDKIVKTENIWQVFWIIQWLRMMKL